MAKDQPKDQGSAFAPSAYHFEASAAALALRLRRPDDVCHTVGSATLMGIGGCACDERREQVRLHRGILRADGYRTEVTGDYDNREGAKALTGSPDGKKASSWHTNRLAVTTTASASVEGMEILNFDDASPDTAQKLRVSRMEAKIIGRRSRKETEKGAPEDTQFQITADFGTVFINGRALKISASPERFNEFPTHGAFKRKFEGDKKFRESYRNLHDGSSMVYQPAGGDGSKLYDRRGQAKVTVVNKIEWVNPDEDHGKIEINGHTVKVPGLGIVYFGEMTISPLRRILQMVRVELGSPFGGSGGGASLDSSGHEEP